MKKSFVLILSLFCLFTSCDREIDDMECHCCNSGGEIGGWDPPENDTLIQKNDTANGGFSISVNEWGDTIYQQIKL